MASNFSIKTTFAAVDRMTAPIRRMARSVDQSLRTMRKSTDDLGKSLDKSASRAQSAARTIATSFSVAALALGTIAKPGADFEQAITDVGAVSLKTRGEIAALEEHAKMLGATTKFTAVQSANAMEEMARAGFSQEAILAGVGGVLSAAAASGLEMAEVAGVVSNTLKGMGLPTTDPVTGLSNAARVADVLTVASSKTNSTIGSLGESMSKLAPVAASFNVSLEDSVAMVALLQDVGLDASEAGTATATMLTKLAKPTGAVAAAMKDMGISFKTAGGDMKDPVSLFNEMLAASDKMPGNMDKVAFFSDLVGLRGQRAALQLQKLFNSSQGEELRGALAGAAGAADKMAALKMDTFIGKLTLLESATDAVRVNFFESNTNLKPIVENMTKWVEQNGALVASGLTDILQGMLRSLPVIARALWNIVRLFLLFKAAAAAVWLVNAALAVYSGIVGGASALTATAAFLTSGYAAAQWMLTIATGGAATGLAAFGLVLATVLLPLTVIGGTIAWVISQLIELKEMLIGKEGSVIDLGLRMLSGQSLTEASDSIMNEQAQAKAKRKAQGLAPLGAEGSLTASAQTALGQGGAPDFEKLLSIMGGASPYGAANTNGAGLPAMHANSGAQLSADQWAPMTDMIEGLAKNPPTTKLEVVLTDPGGVVADVRRTGGNEGVKVRRTGTD